MSSSAKPSFTDRQSLFDTFRTHVNRGKVETFERYGFDAVMGRRQGATFHDAFDSRSWLNAHCNGGVFNLGHRHPAVLAAVRAALEEVDIGNHHLPSPWRAELARRLATTTGGRLSGVVFGVSGGEAVDLAIKVARAATRRHRIVSVSGGYHGHTGLALATGDVRYRERFGPNLPGFLQVPFNELAALERAVDDDTAAVILEPIPATLGMPIPTEGYLASVQALCRQRGARLLLDEVQTGLGRTGKMWAYQHDSLEPDAVVVGKGLSGGIYPITATLMTPELHALFDEEPFIHISTFGGAEPGCAAGLAVLDVVEAPGFLEHVHQLAAFFREGLSGLPFELRQRGLMMGLKFEAEGLGMMAAKVLFDAGLFTVYANNDTSVLQFLPPLVTTGEEAARMVELIRRAFA